MMESLKIKKLLLKLIDIYKSFTTVKNAHEGIPQAKKIRQDLKIYDKKIDTIFPSAVLTLISIIQGVTFYVFADKSLSVFIKDNGALFLILPQSLISFMLLILTTFEYIWFVGLFTGTVYAVDIAIIFIIGFCEVSQIYYLEYPANWWLINSISCAVALFAFKNSHKKAQEIDFEPETIKTLLEGTLYRNQNLCKASFYLSFVTYLFIKYSAFSSKIPYISSFVFIIFILKMFIEDQKFMQKIRLESTKEFP